MGAVLAAECERARSRASLGLDGELSQVEQALLRAHVGRCAQCAEFARDLGGLTQELRAAPAVPSRAAGMPARRRRSGRLVLRLGAVAAAIVVAAALGSLAGSLSSREPSQQAATAAIFTPHALRVAALSASKPTRLPGTRLQTSAPV